MGNRDGRNGRMTVFARGLCATLVVGAVSMAGAVASSSALARSYGFRAVVGGGVVAENAPATQANLIGLTDVVADAAGNLYLTETWGNRLRKIAPNGTITTVVGGPAGFGGDNGPAAAAMINGPKGLARDAAGNLYFSDSRNRRVRRISSLGVITTVAGNGVTADAGDGGNARSASFVDPSGLAIDGAGNLYVADAGAHRVRKVAPNGTITSVAGTGTPGNSGDNGPATAAQINQPAGIDVDAGGNLFIADFGNSAVRKVATDGTITTVYAQAGAFPGNVAVSPSGELYTINSGECVVYKFAGDTWVPYAGRGGPSQLCSQEGEGWTPIATGIGAIDGIAFDAAGNVYLADHDYNRVRRITANDGLMRTWAGVGLPNFLQDAQAVGAPISSATGLAVAPDETVGYVEGPWTRKIRNVPMVGAFAGHFATGAGSGYVVPSYACSLPCLATSFSFVQPFATTFAPDGTQYISDRGLRQVYKLAFSNLYLVADNIDATGMVVDASSNLLVADQAGNIVRRVAPNGTITTFAAANGPTQLAIDAQGNVYVYESTTRRIRRWSAAGTTNVVFAGNGSADVSGDGGPATAAGIGTVNGIATFNDSVFFSSNGRLRRVAKSGTIETLGGASDYAMGVATRAGMLYVAMQNGRIVATPLHPKAHDFDGDGRADLFWRHPTNGSNALWKSGNSATQMGVAKVTDVNWKVVGTGDFDGDGRTDLFWRNTKTGANAIWRGAISTQATTVVSVTDQKWQVAGVGDFDGDGRSDVFWRNATTNQHTIWRSANNLTQTNAGSFSSYFGWELAGVGDFDGDGRDDVLWRNQDTSVMIWKDGISRPNQEHVDYVDAKWKVVGTGDVDGDGRTDIVWRHSVTGANVVWKAANSATSVNLVAVTQQAWQIQRVADFDGDGRADLFWRNVSSGANTIWRSGDNRMQTAVTGVTDLSWRVVPNENQP